MAGGECSPALGDSVLLIHSAHPLVAGHGHFLKPYGGNCKDYVGGGDDWQKSDCRKASRWTTLSVVLSARSNASTSLRK